MLKYTTPRIINWPGGQENCWVNSEAVVHGDFEPGTRPLLVINANEFRRSAPQWLSAQCPHSSSDSNTDNKSHEVETLGWTVVVGQHVSMLWSNGN